MLQGFKTVIFNVVMGVIMFVRALSPESELPTEEAVTTSVDALDAFLTAAWAVGNLILRAVTNAPIFNRNKEGQ